MAEEVLTTETATPEQIQEAQQREAAGKAAAEAQNQAYLNNTAPVLPKFGNPLPVSMGGTGGSYTAYDIYGGVHYGMDQDAANESAKYASLNPNQNLVRQYASMPGGLGAAEQRYGYKFADYVQDYSREHPSAAYTAITHNYALQQARTIDESGIVQQRTPSLSATQNPFDPNSAAGIAWEANRVGGTVGINIGKMSFAEGYAPMVTSRSDISTVAPTDVSSGMLTGSKLVAALPDETVDVYVPYGHFVQEEIENAKILVDTKTGELAFYTQPTGHSIWSLASGGGRAAAQSGMFTIEQPETPYVLSRGDVGKYVMPSGEGMSRLGAEAYGGYVRTMDNRVLQDNDAISRYGGEFNLANYVDQIPAGKSEVPGADIPWEIPAGSPAIQRMDASGVIAGSAIPVPTGGSTGFSSMETPFRSTFEPAATTPAQIEFVGKAEAAAPLPYGTQQDVVVNPVVGALNNPVAWAQGVIDLGGRFVSTVGREEYLPLTLGLVAGGPAGRGANIAEVATISGTPVIERIALNPTVEGTAVREASVVTGLGQKVPGAITETYAGLKGIFGQVVPGAAEASPATARAESAAAQAAIDAYPEYGQAVPGAASSAASKELGARLYDVGAVVAVLDTAGNEVFNLGKAGAEYNLNLASGVAGAAVTGAGNLYRDITTPPEGSAPIEGTNLVYRTDPLAVALEGALYAGDQLTFGLASPGKDLLKAQGQSGNTRFDTFSENLATVNARAGEYDALGKTIEGQRADIAAMTAGKINAEGQFTGTPEEYASYKSLTDSLNTNVAKYNAFGQEYRDVIAGGYASGAIIRSGEGFIPNPDFQHDYGAFSDWSRGAGQAIQRAMGIETPYTESQLIAFEQTPEFKNAGPIMQFGEGAFKVVGTHPESLAGAALQGVEIYATMGTADIALAGLGARGAAMGGTAGSVLETAGFGGQRVLNSALFQGALGAGLIGYSVYETTEGFTLPSEQQASRLGELTTHLTAMGWGAYAPEGLAFASRIELPQTNIIDTMAGSPGMTTPLDYLRAGPEDIGPTGGAPGGGPAGGGPTSPAGEWSFTDFTNPVGRQSRVYQSDLEDWYRPPPDEGGAAALPPGEIRMPSDVEWTFMKEIPAGFEPRMIGEARVTPEPQVAINPDQILIPARAESFWSQPARSMEAPTIETVSEPVFVREVTGGFPTRMDQPAMTRDQAMDYVKGRYPSQSEIWNDYMTQIQRIDMERAPEEFDMRPKVDLTPEIDVSGLEGPVPLKDRLDNFATSTEQRMIIDQYGLTPEEIATAKTNKMSLNDILASRESSGYYATPMERRMIIEQYGLTEDEIAFAKENRASLNDILARRETMALDEFVVPAPVEGSRGNVPILESPFIRYSERYAPTETTSLNDYARAFGYAPASVAITGVSQDYARVEDVITGTRSMQDSIVSPAQDYARMSDVVTVPKSEAITDIIERGGGRYGPSYGPEIPPPVVVPPIFGAGVGGQGPGVSGPRKGFRRYLEYFPVGLDISMFGTTRGANPFTSPAGRMKYLPRDIGLVSTPGVAQERSMRLTMRAVKVPGGKKNKFIT